jgi:hypothetical protein
VRNRSILVIVALALITSLSADGRPDRMIDLPVEPQRSPIANTLADAARRHDFPTFDSMYRTAVSRQSVAAFDELHSLWNWAMTDPIGAFYGQARYERYARMFPGYARFIEEYRIVDSNGNSFFPTAETRKFLLEQALSRTLVVPVPVIQVAESIPVTREQAVSESAGQRILPVASKPVASKPVASKPAPAPVVVAPAPAPVVVREVVREEAPTLVVIASTKPTTAANEAKTTIGLAEASPYVSRVTPPPAQNRDGLGRGIFMIIAGLLGVGMLTMMLQTPATRS